VKIYLLYGTPGNKSMETVQGTPGNDKIYPMGGWDFVEGFAGTDTVWVQGPASEFKIVMEDGYVWVDTVAGASAYANRVQLKDVELVQFTDKLVDLVAQSSQLVEYDNPTTQNFTGGLGKDTVIFDLPIESFSIYASGSKHFITPKDITRGRDSLQSIERLQFSDQNVALDIAQGVGGTVAKFLGVVFGASAVLDRQMVGIGMHFGDALQNNPTGLMRLALDAKLGPNHSDEELVELLFFNLFGFKPADNVRDQFVQWIDSGQQTQESLALLAAEQPENLSNISWMGLVENGLSYVPLPS
jgi:hypothetical protein